ncbi:MAG TPA: hypothetical protein VK453_14440 [Micromonosporaceae bacterium]|nr:hypothetical protein [Micromonosporaceae bacterium]
MTSAAPWWAVPAASVLTVLLTLTWTTRAEQARRRLERSKQWDPQKMNVYISYWNASVDLLDLAVWSVDPSAEHAASRPLTDQIGRLYREIAFRSPGIVARAAYEAADRAATFASVVEDIRRTTTRGAHGVLDPAAQERYEDARQAMAAAVDEFALAARADVNVSDPYEPPRSLTRDAHQAR